MHKQVIPETTLDGFIRSYLVGQLQLCRVNWGKVSEIVSK